MVADLVTRQHCKCFASKTGSKTHKQNSSHAPDFLIKSKIVHGSECNVALGQYHVQCRAETNIISSTSKLLVR